MNQKKELIKNTFIIFIGSFSTKLLSFILLPFYTALLDKSEYGSFNLLNTISVFLIPLITLQLEESLFRFFIDAKDNQDKGKVFTQTVLYVFSSFIIWSILILLFSYIFKYEYSIWLILFLFGSVCFSIFTSFARGEGNFKIYSIYVFINSALNIILNILFIAVFDLGLTGLFLAYIIAGFVVGICGLIKLKAYKYLKKKYISATLMKEMIKYSLPLVPNNISWHAISLTDSLVITNILNLGANGIYSVANRFPTIITTCYGYFNTSWRESASKIVSKDEKNEFYNSVYLNLRHFLIGVCILLVALLPFVFNLLVNKSYSSAYIYIPLMLLTTYYSNLSNFSSGIFAAYKDNKILAPTTLVAAVINLILNLLLIKKIGLFAPIVGTLISYFIINIYRNYKLKKYVKLESDKYNIISILMFLGITMIYYSNSLILFIIGLIVASIYFYLLNKGLIITILNHFMKKFRKKV